METHTNRTRPIEAASVLSVTEEKLIDRLNTRFNSMSKDMINRIGNLTAKSAYEACLSSLLIEDIYLKIGNSKADYERKRKEAAQRMRKRLYQEGATDTADAQEKTAKLEAQLNKAKDRFQQMNKQINELEESNKKKDQQVREVENWAKGLIDYLTHNYSRIKNNTVLVEEYQKKNPFPGG